MSTIFGYCLISSYIFKFIVTTFYKDIWYNLFNQIIWSEKKDHNNIGIIDHNLGLALDTLISFEPETSISINMTEWINGSGIYSLALGSINQDDHVIFCSNEAMYTSGYTPYPSYWPSLSFTPNIDSVKVVPLLPADDSSIVLNSFSSDSILFEWYSERGMQVPDWKMKTDPDWWIEYLEELKQHGL